MFLIHLSECCSWKSFFILRWHTGYSIEIPFKDQGLSSAAHLHLGLCFFNTCRKERSWYLRVLPHFRTLLDECQGQVFPELFFSFLRKLLCMDSLSSCCFVVLMVIFFFKNSLHCVMLCDRHCLNLVLIFEPEKAAFVKRICEYKKTKNGCF